MNEKQSDEDLLDP